MNFMPDLSSSDEDGLSDDNEYQEFKQKMREKQRETNCNIENENVDPEMQLRNRIYTHISCNNTGAVIAEFENGFSIETDLKNGWTPLLLAASLGNPDLVEYLLGRRPCITNTFEGSTVVMLACDLKPHDSVKRRLETIKILAQYGADLDACDRKRRTAIMIAANTGNLEAVDYLLPLCNKLAEDNQRWNALFWAVDGNQLEVVKCLLENGFDWDKTDIRGQTVRNIAEHNGFYDIVEIIPNHDNEQLALMLNNNLFNFEETFANQKNDERPKFFADVRRMLYSIRTENLIPIFDQHNVSLYDFLCCNESQLKNIGIVMPFQRKQIMSGLYKFHNHAFEPQSVPFVDKKEIYSNIDLGRTVLSAVKQIIVMESSLKFIINNYTNDIPASEMKEIAETLKMVQKKVWRLKRLAAQLEKNAAIWDASLEQADLIKKKRRNIPWAYLMTASVFLVTLVTIKYFRK